MIKIKGNGQIEWMYPEIYDRGKQSTLEIGMCHTRATDSIRIKYDSDRDGWIIEQASTFEWDSNDKKCDPDWQEVSFIQAWGREKPKLSDNSDYATASPKLPRKKRRHIKPVQNYAKKLGHTACPVCGGNFT